MQKQNNDNMKKITIAFALITFLFVSCTENTTTKNTKENFKDSIVTVKDRIKRNIEKYTNSERNYEVNTNDTSIVIKSVLKSYDTDFIDEVTIPIKSINNVIIEKYKERIWVVIKTNGLTIREMYIAPTVETKNVNEKILILDISSDAVVEQLKNDIINLSKLNK